MTVRRGEYNPLFAAEKVALQYVCDAALKIENDDLRYIEKHRQRLCLRSETVANLRLHIQSEAARLQKLVGRIQILPASHPGSPRNLYKH